jgi:N-acetylmuramoyl-L-alanine amidase
LTLGSASDEQAKLLADLENAADIVDGGSIFEEDVTGILFDLKQQDVLRQSERLAEAILNNLTEDRRLSSRGVKQARFAVLKSPITPSVLVETAFINNPREAKLLRDPKFQEHLADQIAEGLLQFMATTPTVARDGDVEAFLARALARQNGKH